MSELEKEIRTEYVRMNRILAQKSDKFTMGNTAETWEALSQYGYPLAYYENKEDAEKHVINFYTKNIHLIRQ